jgi:cell division GTPase FtsZ
VRAGGKALEIVTVGLGQAGGNLAAEFARRGYRALALNTASSDLSTLSSSGLSLPEDQRLYIGVDGHDGAGSDVSYGRQCIAAHAGKIRERVSEHANGADLVLLTCGLGGGTGSAIVELVKALEDLQLPMVVLATLPSSHESGIAKVNAVRAVNDLIKEHVLGWIFVDNSRLAEAHGSVSLDRYYTEVNRVIAEPVDGFNRLNERKGVSPIRTLDGEDLRSLLLSGGLLNFGSRTMGKLISEQLKDETGGGAIYLGVYRDEQAQQATVRLICSSQSLPEGVREMVSAARREGAQLRDKLAQTLTGLDLGEIEEYELFRSSPGTIRRPRIAEQPGARKSMRPSMSAPAPERPAPERPTSERLAQQAGSASIPPPATQSGVTADRETYDQMVREYKSASSEDVKKRVLDRLDADRRSENSLVRYYAVRAMTKLDPALFADALQAATQDEDATVRAIATKALQSQQQQRA